MYKCVIWRFIDGKPGHENQSQGLIDALSKRLDLKTYNIHALDKTVLFASFFNKRKLAEIVAEPPSICLGAGHGTHLSILISARQFGAKSIVLMKPSLPTKWFDFCAIPEHDGIRQGDNLFYTQGVLNRVQHCTDRDKSKGLILLGGPSKHYFWSNRVILEQLCMLINKQPLNWVIATSRRTPSDLISALKKLKSENSEKQITIVKHEDVDHNWLPGMLSSVGIIWVSTDSVSMVYEGLSSGAACGLLTLKKNKDSRVTNALDKLVAQQIITPFDKWLSGQVLSSPNPVFSEAARCADEIIIRFGLLQHA